MLRSLNLPAIKQACQNASLLAIAAVVAIAGLVPLVYQSQASAATLTSRSVLISTSEPDVAGVSYTFNFTTVDTPAPIQSIVLQFCDTPLGSCTLPGTDGTPTAAERIDVSHVTASYGSISGWTNSTAFAEYTGADSGACDEADGGSGVATMYCLTRTEAANETDGSKTLVINDITNPIVTNTNYEEIYVRVSLYQTTGFATLVDNGVVAANIVNPLTVNGRVQERLVFCVFALDDTAATNATVGTAATNFPTDCTANEAQASSTVDIGVIDNTTIARSPVDNTPPASLGNDRFGAAIVNTNASSGVTVAYYPDTPASGTNQLRSFRVTGASCDASNTTLTDQCFRDAATTGTTFTAGSERFGMHLACIANANRTNDPGTTANLGSGGAGTGASGGTFNTDYGNVDDSMADTNENCENDDAGQNYAWDSAGTAVNLVHSSTVVDDEMMKMRFGATAEATTPTGSYTVSTIYIATPVF